MLSWNLNSFTPSEEARTSAQSWLQGDHRWTRCQQFNISVATGFLLAAIGNAQLVHAAVEGRGINP